MRISDWSSDECSSDLSIRRTEAKEMIMGMFQPISVASDRVMAALVSGLEIEFGHGVGEALAHRFLEAEETEFLWDARDMERWIGAYERSEEHTSELQSLMRISYAVFCLKQKTIRTQHSGNPVPNEHFVD